MQRIVLAGCGHAHLEVLRLTQTLRAAGGDVVLVDPGRFWYSGLGSAVLGGRCGDEAASLDPAQIASACGASFFRDRIAGLDREARIVTLGSGERLAYDILSLNVGSVVPIPPNLGGAQAVKPIADLAGLRETIATSGGNAVIVGGGATGCELAGNLIHLGAARGIELRVSLVTAGNGLVETAPAGAARSAQASLSRRGVRLFTGSAVSGSECGKLRLADGKAIAFDHLLLATGLAPQPMVHHLGLPSRAAGLRVGATLASIADGRIFAAGDCAAIEGYDLAKVGVYGVRAGPVLARNLLACLEGRPLETFRPQARYLSILDLADARGIAMRGGWWGKGRLALGLKNHLDRSFMERYRRLYAA